MKKNTAPKPRMPDIDDLIFGPVSTAPSGR